MKKVKTNFLVKNLVLWWKKRFCTSNTFSLYSSFSAARSVLVCFPANREEFAYAANHLPSIADVFSSSKVYPLLPFLEADGFLYSLKSYEVIMPYSKDVRTFFLPNRRFVERIRSYGFGITIDLDLDGCFFNALTCLASSAPLRIGLKGGLGKPFYNMELAVESGLLYPDQKYDAVIEILQSIRNGKET